MATANDLMAGYPVVREASDKSGIPVVLTTGRKACLEEFLRGSPDMRYVGQPLSLEPYMHRSWEAFLSNQ